MNAALGILVGILVGFFFGCLMPGYWIGKFCFDKDIRDEGSGNVGATNAFRVLGPAVGILVLCLDVAKGVLAVWVSRQVGGIDLWSGLAAILGHTFSPFVNFRGGKGVATGLGVFLCLALNPTIAAFCAFVLAILVTRRVSPASCLASLTLGVGVPMTSRDIPLIAITEIAVVLILVRHRSNIARLVRGEEPPLF